MSNNKKTTSQLAGKCFEDNRVQHALDLAFELLGNPIVLIDLSYNLLCHTKNVGVDDPLWKELLSLGTFSHETVDFFNSEKFIEAFAKTDSIAIMKSSKLKYDRASCAIYDQNGVQIGSYCIVAYYRPFEERDFDVMEKLSAELSLLLSDGSDQGNQPCCDQERLVCELIEGNTENICECTLAKLYDGLKKTLFVAVIDIIQYEKTLTHLEYFKNLFCKIKGEFKYFTYLNNIIVILSKNEPVLSTKNDLAELDRFFSSYKIFAGISDGFSNLTELRTYFKQALNALNFGLELKDGKTIYMFADFRLEAYIKEYPEKLLDLCHPTALIIHDYDKEHQTNYRETLYNYIYCGTSIQKTAQKMGITELELNRRLADIEQIFYVDFDNANSLLTLYRSMRLSRYFPEKFA